MILTTPRLRLEPFETSHFEGLLALNSDPVAMRFFKSLATAEDIRAWIRDVEARWVRLGYAWWSFMDRGTDALVGAGCIQNLEKDETKPLEVGWRLRPEVWGQGYATEAARAVLAYGFGTAGLRRIVAVVRIENDASRKVLHKLGFRHERDGIFYGAEASLMTLDPPRR